jgi:murein DD-endopeptidase MepM/ murein hydrolase activator NlpD
MKLLTALLITFITSTLSAQESRYFASFNAKPSGTRWYGVPYYAGSNSTAKTYHAGIDYTGSRGAAITAVGSGRVVSIYKSGLGDRGLGNSVIIQHAMSSPLFSLYGHLDSIDPVVTVGAYVSKGQRLGTMGSTGAGSNNIVHLHFEMKTINSLSNTSNVGVGYTTVPPDQLGYRDPAKYFGVAQYGDFTLGMANPTTAKKGAGLIAKPTINNPFSQASKLDLKLQVLSTSGAVLKDLSFLYGQTISVPSMGFTFSTTSHGLAAGSYKLQVLYKAANSTTWFVLPFGTASNPWNLTVTN